jgi:rubrerythrin
MSTTYDLFRVAEEVELGAARLYRLLAEQFRGNAEAHSLFSRLELEEVQHAERVRLQRSLCTVDPGMFAAGDLHARGLHEHMEQAERLIEAMTRKGATFTFADARRLMAGLEKKFAEAHHGVMPAITDAKLREFFESLATQDLAHAELLGKG